jgi:ubiquinone/menaquinone biosynthesis C-methylase UbiE
MLKSVLRRAPWIPGVAAVVSFAALGAAVIWGAGLALTLVAGWAVAGSFYAWGYSARGWPALIHLPRRSYGAVWDAVASSEGSAAVGVSGYGTEEELRASAAEPVRNLRELAGITAQDCVLEIGCGLGRIGRELAPLCREWTGADMSAKMLGFARERLKGLANVRLVHLREASLAGFEDASFDVVYSTNAFPHIDEMDRWRYVEEAWRVLRAGGRIFIDNVGIESDAGWAMFVNDAERFRELERPPYMPRYSTAAELTAYLGRAGFSRVRAEQRGAWVVATGVKG